MESLIIKPLCNLSIIWLFVFFFKSFFPLWPPLILSQFYFYSMVSSLLENLDAWLKTIYPHLLFWVIMVRILILDGNSEIGSHGAISVFYLFKTWFDNNHELDFLLQKDQFFFLRAQHVLSYHIIWIKHKELFL